MARASGYVLLVPPERVSTLLERAKPGVSVGEPVPVFSGSRRAPLLVIASFAPGAITHVAAGRKGLASGTQLVRLNLSEMEELTAPIPVRRLLDALPPRTRGPVARRLENGGLLPPAAFQATVTALRQLAPDIAGRLLRFSGERARRVSLMSPEARRALEPFPLT